MNKKNIINNKSILITGGTGSFGKHLVKTILANYKPRRLIVFSRDELKQYEMSLIFPTNKYPCLRYFIGDIRDRTRIERACNGVDLIVHAAAMKHIDAAEYNPTECIATNIYGAENLIDASIKCNVEKVIALSTDKAANPINLYGATKLASDKLFIAANNLSGKHKTRFMVVRYGNVLGSRGSVLPFFNKLIKEGIKSLPVTDNKMTRFVITLSQGVDFVIRALESGYGGEIIVPKLPSINIIDLVAVLLKKNSYHEVGIRPGEKLHETMIPFEESSNSMDMGDHFIIQPTHHWWNYKKFSKNIKGKGKKVIKPFEYNSGNNNWFLSQEELKELIKKL